LWVSRILLAKQRTRVRAELVVRLFLSHRQRYVHQRYRLSWPQRNLRNLWQRVALLPEPVR